MLLRFRVYLKKVTGLFRSEKKQQDLTIMDEFEKLALQIPKHRRCIQSRRGKRGLWIDECFFGVPQSRLFGWGLLTKIHLEAKGFHFLIGGGWSELLTAFCKSPWAQTVERLRVGSSGFFENDSLDYRPAIASISNTIFPKLESLSIGTWELFHNAHCLFGNLGDITELISHAPQLKRLSIGGHFILSKALNHALIETIDIQIDDATTSYNGGELSQQTLDFLLNSNLPNLQEFSLDLAITDATIAYQLTDCFLNASQMQQLKKVSIYGNFEATTKEQLLQSQLAKQAKISFEQIDSY